MLWLRWCRLPRSFQSDRLGSRGPRFLSQRVVQSCLVAADCDWDYVDWDEVNALDEALRHAEVRCEELLDVIDAASLNRAIARGCLQRQQRAQPDAVHFDPRDLLSQNRFLVSRGWWEHDGPLNDPEGFDRRADAMEDSLRRFLAAIDEMVASGVLDVLIALLAEVLLEVVAAALPEDDRPHSPRIVALPYASQAPPSLTTAPLEWVRAGRLAA